MNNQNNPFVISTKAEEIMKKLSSINKILCTALILAFTVQSSFAVQNYVHTTTTTEQYSASSPVGNFENYTTNAGASAATVAQPVYDYNYYQPVPAANIPVAYCGSLNYNTASGYVNPEYNQTYSKQDIDTPQEYTRTVTTTDQSVDTREKADKVIDRGIKVLGALSIVGAVVGLIISAT